MTPAERAVIDAAVRWQNQLHAKDWTEEKLRSMSGSAAADLYRAIDVYKAEQK